MSLPQPSAEQQVIQNDVIAGHSVVVNAVVGAGKSTACFQIAAALRESCVAQGQPERGKSLLLCFNASLQADTEIRVRSLGMSDFIHCFTVHGMMSRMFKTVVPGVGAMQTLIKNYQHKPETRDGVEKCDYDLCFIDEAQDLDQDMVNFVRILQHQNIFTDLQFVVVGDERQEIYTFNRTASVDILRRPAWWLTTPPEMQWRSRALKQSFRLTPNMCTFINTHFPPPALPDGTLATIEPGNLTSPNNRVQFVVGNSSVGHLLTLVLRLLDQFKPEGMMILVPSVNAFVCQDLRLKLAATHARPVFCTAQNTAGGKLEELVKGKVIISSFHQSKGLERPCVLVFNIGGAYQDLWSREKNPLHVALTRARQQLVIYQEFNEPRLSAFENMDVLSRTCDIEWMASEMRMLHPRREFQRRQLQNITSTRLVTFVPRDFVGRLVEMQRESIPRLVGEMCSAVPSSMVAREMVRAAFKPAILAAFQHTRTHQCELLTFLRQSKDQHRLPPFCTQAIKTLASGIAKDTPCSTEEWLTLGVAFVAIDSGNLHVPHQLGDMTWVTKDDCEYFQTCVNNLLALTHQHPNAQYDKTFDRATPSPNSVTIKTRIEFVSRSSSDMSTSPTAWIFSLDDCVLDVHRWEAAFMMWTLRINTALIYFVASNRIIQLKIEDSVSLDKLVQDLVQYHVQK